MLARMSPDWNDVCWSIAPVRKPLPSGLYGDEADAELFQPGQDLGFRFAPPQRVLALHRGDRLRTDRSGLLAGVDEVLDGARDVLDRHVRVDPVLIEQVDRLDPQPARRCPHGLLDVLGAAGQSDLVALLVEAEPNLVAMTTSPRNGARASPTTCSLVTGPYTSAVSRVRVAAGS
jgi:hypothetical protein